MTTPAIIQVNTGKPGEKLSSDPEPVTLDNSNLEGKSQEELAARQAIEEFMKLPLVVRQAKIAAVLDRGIINDRLAVDLPADLHGEWCRDDVGEIDRLKAMGFWEDNTYATKRAIHSDGSSSAKIGDVRFMVTMRDNKNMIDKIMQTKMENTTKSRKQIQEEERQFASATHRDTEGIIPTYVESKQEDATRDSVKAAVEAANRQTQIK